MNETNTIEITKGNFITYKNVGNNGIWFHQETPDEVCRIINALYVSKTRVKIYCGDVTTGKAWIEENDTTGTIGKSHGGTISIPLLIERIKDGGGHGILDHCIVGIRKTGNNKFLYRHPKLQTPQVEIREGSDLPGYTHETWVNDQLFGRHRSIRSAQACQKRLI